jgi:hypothetical protein
MVSGETQSRSQRTRWEAGRFQLIRQKTLPLLAAAVSRRSAVCLDLGLDLMVLPLSYVALNAFALMVVAAGASWYHPALLPYLWAGIACLVAQVLYVLRGWQLSEVGLQGLIDLGRAPFFLLWKVLLLIRPRKSRAWVRTDREIK